MGGDREHLAEIKLLRGLTPAERAEVARRCHWMDLAPGVEVVGHLENSHDVYFVVSGRVRVALHSPSGRRVAYRDMGSGEQFGELAAIDEAPRSATVVTMEPTSLARMSAKEFRTLLERYPEVQRSLLQQLVQLVRQLTDRVYEVSATPVRERVRTGLLRLAIAAGVEDNQAQIPRPPTHEEFAEQLSTHREAVTRELSELHRHGLVRRQGRQWMITDVRALAESLELPGPMSCDEPPRDRGQR